MPLGILWSALCNRYCWNLSRSFHNWKRNGFWHSLAHTWYFQFFFNQLFMSYLDVGLCPKKPLLTIVTSLYRPELFLPSSQQCQSIGASWGTPAPSMVIEWRVRGENYQVCSMQYCVQQLCTVQCTHIWTDLTVLWVGFCLTGPISLCLDSLQRAQCSH